MARNFMKSGQSKVSGKIFRCEVFFSIFSRIKIQCAVLQFSKKAGKNVVLNYFLKAVISNWVAGGIWFLVCF